MALMRNRIKGARNRASGTGFEILIKANAERSGWTCTRIPNGCRWIGPGKIVAEKTPFDFVITKRGRAVFFDAKSIVANKFTHSMVDLNQVHALQPIGEDLFPAGYIVWFRKAKKVGFIPVLDLVSLKPRCSISLNQTIILGDSDQRIEFDRIFDGPAQKEEAAGITFAEP